MNASPTVDYNLDWLTVSFDWTATHTATMPHKAFEPTTEFIRPLPGYNRAIKLNVGRLDWHTEKVANKRLLTFSGSELSKLRLHNISTEQFLRMITRLPHRNITRLDFAVDLFGAQTRAVDIKNLLEYGHVETSAKKSTNIEQRILGSEGKGMTVYIGSRSSQQMIRAYDKDMERGVNFPWLRLEIEMKQEKANLLAENMLGHGVIPSGCAAIRQFARIDNPEIEGALQGELEIDLAVGRKQTNWEKWLIEVALPAVAKGAEMGIPAVIEWVKSLDMLDKVG